ncbi:unnamed protein product [Durusdinium trenchii]|uniref:EF-hand domain-containing protein n=2 Tax=Durusdinium trenchii TaxID=1381693 RepID=A0ABP0K512_9DINO
MPARRRASAVWGFSLLIAVLLAGRQQAFLATQRGRSLALRAAADEGVPSDEPRRRDPMSGGIQDGMRSKLMEEAKSLGDEETPISAGFGNPYLLAIIVILILGVASYFQLGLDKVASVKSTDAGDKDCEAERWSDEAGRRRNLFNAEWMAGREEQCESGRLQEECAVWGRFVLTRGTLTAACCQSSGMAGAHCAAERAGHAGHIGLPELDIVSGSEVEKLKTTPPGGMAAQEKDGQSRLKKLQKVIKDAFSCFDKQQKWLIEQDEVGVVMRYLGQFPSESDLKETIIPELLEEDPSKDGMISFEAFERLMLRCLSDHTYDPDDSETLLAAFRVLDPQGHGYIDSNLMHEWLSTKGGKASDFFKERETSDFLEYAKDKDSSDSSRIYYEDYVAKLNADIEKHLENLYQAARGTGARAQ